MRPPYLVVTRPPITCDCLQGGQHCPTLFVKSSRSGLVRHLQPRRGPDHRTIPTFANGASPSSQTSWWDMLYIIVTRPILTLPNMSIQTFTRAKHEYPDWINAPSRKMPSRSWTDQNKETNLCIFSWKKSTIVYIGPHIPFGMTTDFSYWNQNCKQVFMFMNNWDKGVAPAICPCILSAGEYWISAGAALPDPYFLMCFIL